jgi:hypothetical protein
MKPKSGGGLLLLRRKTPLPRRSVAYFYSGAHKWGAELTRRLAAGENRTALAKEFAVTRVTVYRYMGRAASERRTVKKKGKSVL